MLEKVDQQKGTDLRGKCKTRLPAFVSVAILEAVQRYYPVPAVRIFYFQDGGDVANPARLSPCILARKCKRDSMPPSRAKNWRQKSANPVLYSVCPRGQPASSRMSADKCITWTTTEKMNMLRCVLKAAKYDRETTTRITYIAALGTAIIYSIQKLSTWQKFRVFHVA